MHKIRKEIYKPGGLDGLNGVWLILRMVITPQLTTKKSKIRTLHHALATIDHQDQ
jgi:pyruvate-formate lyase-activating enzyme